VVLKARVTAPGQSFALEHPTEQHAEDLVRIDEVAVLVGGADAVGVAVGAQAGLAAVGHHRLAQGADVRLDGLGIDAGKERVGVAANLHVATPMRVKMSEMIGAARAVHRVDGELHAGFRDQVEVGEALDGLEVGGRKSTSSMGAGWAARERAGRGRTRSRRSSRACRSRRTSLVLDAVPLRRIVRGGDHDAAGAPCARARRS
jgi:hypothetical protein